MKILIVYYSRTGTTAKIAKEIASELKCELEEVIDKKNRKGLLSWLSAGSDGTLKRTTSIDKTTYDPSDFDLVIIGTPIWVNTTPAIRTYLGENARKFKKVAFFCTMGGSESKRVFEEMTQLAGKAPVAVMGLVQKYVQQDDYRNRLREFISQITQ